MPKVSIIGAGNVGATTAMRIAEGSLADVVLMDIVRGLPQGRALDLFHAMPILPYSSAITGTNDWSDIQESDVVIIAAGQARTPGMQRKDLLAKNISVVKDVVGNIIKYCPHAVMLMVTNPLDIMTYLAYKLSGFPPNRVVGMAGVLDSARFSALIAKELGISPSTVQAIMLGSHGDSMVPLISCTTVSGIPIPTLLSQEKIDRLVAQTRSAGGDIVNLLGSGSAYFAPSAAVYEMVKSIVKDEKKLLCVSAFLDGHYGERDIYIGVPAKIGRGGVEEVVEVELGAQEREAFEKSVKAIRCAIEEMRCYIDPNIQK